ncbi:MAG TPA: ATP-binding protein [Chloroflexia bacterium]|nr:ATP-binding protein [Chloroflexia bacterium]
MARTQQAPDATTKDPSNTRGSNTDEFRTRVSQLLGELRTEAEALGREQSEIDMLLRQTNGEVEKLAQRELGMTNRVRDMELNLDNYSRTDMKTIYNSAHEIQMRLFMMRAQVEQLEAKRNSMKNLQQHIGRSNSVLQSVPDEVGASPVGQKNIMSGPLTSRANTGGLGDTQTTADGRQVLSQVIQAQEDERLYVSRQMHDGPAQTMTNLVLRAEICERLMDVDPVRAKNELVGLKNVVNTTLQDTRRFIFDLRPMILDDLGLEPTLRRYVQQFTDKFKIEVGVTINGLNGRLPGPIEVAIFRIVQEALTNVSKHAHSTHAQVSIDVNSMNGDVVSISIEDDGSGFTADEAKMNNPKFRGLATMRQRVEMYGGQLNINTAPGKGTHISANLPAQLAV